MQTLVATTLAVFSVATDSQAAHNSPGLVWVDAHGKVVGTPFGDRKVVIRTDYGLVVAEITLPTAGTNPGISINDLSGTPLRIFFEFDDFDHAFAAEEHVHDSGAGHGIFAYVFEAEGVDIKFEGCGGVAGDDAEVDCVFSEFYGHGVSFI